MSPDRRALLQSRISELLRLLMGRFHARLVATMREVDLSPPQLFTLRMLRDAPLSMRELAEAHRCDASNMTGIADRLEARGLLQRRSSPTDRRVKLLALTPAGHELIGSIEAVVFEPAERITEQDIDIADAERLVAFLERLLPSDAPE